MLPDKIKEHLLVPFRTKNIYHAVNIPKVFGGPAFAIELKFSQNHVLGRGKRNFASLDFGNVSVGKSPNV